jgi:hypothetical protein
MESMKPEDMAAELERATGQEKQTAAMLDDAYVQLALADQARVPTELFCPQCKHQHVDKDEGDIDWTMRIHKKHLCAACGHIWRPYPVSTVGVDFHAQCRAAREACDLAVAELRRQVSDQARLIAENQQLTVRRDELLQLVAKLSREEPQDGELEECKSGHAAVGTLRAKLEEMTTEMDIREDVADDEGSIRGHERQRYLCSINVNAAGGGYADCETRKQTIVLEAEVLRLKAFEDAYVQINAALAGVPVLIDDVTGQPCVDRIKTLRRLLADADKLNP